ncbi:MAG: pitrilysin family protein [Phycisphaerae bacterium]|nr:pitrilysin family protein [Phycisphaerae bacterium]
MTVMFAAASLAESPRYNFQSKTLPNGLRVVTLEDFACPVVAVHVWYHVGAANEDPQRQGFAHLFEHMMFRGTDRLGPKDHFEWIHRSGGDCNGYTSFDQTVYTNRMPSNQLALALWLEAERMGMLKIDADGFATERKVVEEERRMGLNRPYSTLYEKMLPAIFAQHPYRWTPIGQIPHLRAASVDEIRAFWQRYYVPNNATLLIVGAVKHEDAQKLAEQYLGWIPRQPDPPRVKPAVESVAQHELVIKEPKGPVPMVGLNYLAVPVAHPDRVPLQFIAEVLGEGRSCRLYVDLVRKQKLAVDVDAGAMSMEHAGTFMLRATLTAGGDKDKALAALKSHVDKIIAEPITEAEWSKAHNQLLRNEVTGAMTVAGKASVLGRYAVTIGDLDRVNRRLDEINAVTREDIQRVAKKYFTADRLTTLIVEPAPGAALDVPGDDALPSTQPTDRCVPRELTRPAAFPKDAPVQPLLDRMPAIKHADKTLPNGLRVVVVPDHRAAFVRMTLGVKFGGWAEDPARPGAAAMAARMIARGTKNYSAERLADELELNAISLDGNASLDVTEVHADCLTEQLDRAGKLLAEVVLRPAFDPAEFNLLRDQTLSNLLIKSKTPDYLADREFRTRMFGSHPYARTATGEPEDLRRLTQADLAGWWKQFIRPDAATLYLAGDIEPDAAFAAAANWLGEWKAEGKLPEAKLPAIPAADSMKIFLVDQPGIVQSEIRIGHPSITRDDPDYFTTRVLTQIFGGAFNSRLNQALRIEKGLTYGVGGSFVAERFAGTFRMRTFTKTARTAETVKALLEQLDLLQTKAPTDEEMNISRSYLVGSFAGSRETPQATVNDLWMLAQCNLPDDFLDRYLDGIGKCKSADVIGAAKRLVHPAQLIIVVVADAAAVKADLEKIAPVTVVTRAAATQKE